MKKVKVRLEQVDMGYDSETQKPQGLFLFTARVPVPKAEIQNVIAKLNDEHEADAEMNI